MVLDSLQLTGVVLAPLLLLRWWLRSPTLELKGKHVVITGGSSGIGQAIALKVAAEGAKVTIVARNKARLEQAKALIGDGGSDSCVVHTVSADVGDAAEAKRAMDEAAVQAGPVDVLICSAGITRPGVFEEVPAAEFERQMRVNYLGTVHCIHAVVGGMKRRGDGGAIVMLASQAGQIGVYGYGAYTPSKFALRGLAESLRMELKPHGVSVSVSYPPDTDTPQLAGEAEFRPPETALISGDAKMFSAAAVAADIVAGLKRRAFRITTGFDGFMLDKATCCLAPVSDPLELLLELVTYPVWRCVGAGMVAYFDWICKGEHSKRARAKAD
eukprot:g4478.t1